MNKFLNWENVCLFDILALYWYKSCNHIEKKFVIIDMMSIVEKLYLEQSKMIIQDNSAVV